MDYKRPSIVPGKIQGISDQTPVISVDQGNSGYNWMLDYQGNVRKRPGSQILTVLEDPFSTEYSLINPSLGVHGTGVLRRRNTANRQIGLNTGTATFALPKEEVVLCGSEYFWRLVPLVVLLKSVVGGGWQVTYDGADKRFVEYLNDELVTSTVIGFGTEASPVSFATLGTAHSATAYAQLAQDGSPAGFLLLGKRVSQGLSITIEAYIASRISTSFFSVPTGGVFPGKYIGQPCPQTSLGVDDTNWNSVLFNDALYFAGRKKPLVKYDGARVYVPGAINTATPSSHGISTMLTSSAGAYNYRLVHRVPVVEAVTASSNGSDISIAFDEAAPYDVANQVLQTFTTPIDQYPVVSYSNFFANPNSGGFGFGVLFGPTGDVLLAHAPMVRTGWYIATASSSGATISLTKRDGTPHDLLPGESIYYWTGTTGQWLYIANVTETTIAVSDTTVTVTAATTTFSLDSVEVYRTVSGGSTYYLVTELPTYLASTYTDAVSDGTLVSNTAYATPSFTAINAPDITSAVCTHQNRLIVAHDSSANDLIWRGEIELAQCLDIAISEALSDQFSADTGFTLNDPLAREIRALASVNDTLYVFTDCSIWYVQGDLSSAETFQVQLLTSAFGAASNTSVQVVDGNIWCLTAAGQIAVIQGGTVSIVNQVKYLPVSEQQNTGEVRDGLSIRHATSGYDATTRQLFFHVPHMTFKRFNTYAPTPSLTTTGSFFGTVNRYQSATVTNQDPSKSLTNVLDFKYGAPMFYLWKGLGAAGGMAYTSFGLLTVSRQQGNDTSKAVIALLDENVAHDQGVGFEMKFQTAWQDLGDVQKNKRPVRLQLLSGTEGTQNFSLSVRTESNWINGVYTDEFTAAFKAGEGYGEQAYGTTPYGDGNEPDKVYPLSGQKSKAIRLTLSNSEATEQPLISGWSFELADNDKNTKEV